MKMIYILNTLTTSEVKTLTAIIGIIILWFIVLAVIIRTAIKIRAKNIDIGDHNKNLENLINKLLNLVDYDEMLSDKKEIKTLIFIYQQDFVPYGHNKGKILNTIAREKDRARRALESGNGTVTDQFIIDQIKEAGIIAQLNH